MMEYVVIVAGGKGMRMGTEVPKQFLPVGGIPVLMRTIQRFYDYDNNLHIILVLPHAQQAYWQQLCEQHHFRIPYQLADGGDTRFDSVKHGLRLIPDNAQGVVAVHDGVRPFVSEEVIRRCFKTATHEGAVIPVIRVVETLRHVNGTTVPRDDYRLVQTPQAFDISRLKQAYGQTYRSAFTDDASVAESNGMKVTLVEGNRENIKITTPFDLIVAEALVKDND